jgi:hypothetical protein
MTVQQAPTVALAQFGGQMQRLAMSPIQRWQQASLMHKVIAAAAGAGMAWWLHNKGMDDLAVAAAALGTAYGTSALMHYPAVSQAAPAPQQAVMHPQALPAAQVNSMAARAQAALTSAPAALPGTSAPAPATNQNVAAPTPMSGVRSKKDLSRFNALG